MHILKILLNLSVSICSIQQEKLIESFNEAKSTWLEAFVWFCFGEGVLERHVDIMCNIVTVLCT